MNSAADGRLAALELENAKLRKIRDVLVRRVERSMELQGSEFALFERATLLEAEVRKRTTQLEQALGELQRSNRVIEDARARADAANLSKTRFLAAASHDLLQPLNAARLFLSALAETDVPTAAERLIENVELSFESIDRLLTALLDISKLDAGVVTPTIEDVPLAPLLLRLATEFAPMAERKGLSLRLVTTSAVVRTDRDMLARALMNLLSNAIRYTRRGGVLIGVRREGGWFRVDVVDTGIGIPQDQQRRDLPGVPAARQRCRAARPWLRSGARDRRADRTHARSIRCSVQSCRAAARAFRCRWPPGLLRPTPTPDATVVHAAARAGGALLVVIENEAAIREGMKVLLQGWGYMVLTASAPEIAIGLLRRSHRLPAALIADFHLDGARVPRPSAWCAPNAAGHPGRGDHR